MRGTVLLADRLDALRESLASVLAERRFRVLHASDREEALSRAPRADIILLDSNLTEEDSLDVVRDLQDRADTRALHIIVHVPKEDPAYTERALRAGAEAVLMRPFDYDALVAQLEEVCPPEKGTSADAERIAGRSEQEIVSFLRTLLDGPSPRVAPEYNPDSSLGYSYSVAEGYFGFGTEEAVGLLEELMALGLLDRRLADKVHLCPSCGWHALNFVEVCPRCGDMDVHVEEVVHHFACAHVGPINEYKQGVELVCPKCGDRLRHMGLDYEKPSETYLCRNCGYVFNESAVEARCFRCEHVTPAGDLVPTSIYAYTPNAKTNRAVEYGRLYGLDLHSVLFQERSRTFRKDYLIYELDREIYRARRYDNALTFLLIQVDGLDEDRVAEAGTSTAELYGQIFEGVTDALRDLDVVSSLEDGLGAILLPETSLDSALEVAHRACTTIREYQSVNMEGQLRVTAAAVTLKEEHADGMELFEYAYRLLLWALKNKPGNIVTPATRDREGENG